jgi:hypothetical protein
VRDACVEVFGESEYGEEVQASITSYAATAI